MIYAVDKHESFLKQFPVFLNAFLVGGPADFFVIEVADQVYSVYSILGHLFSEELVIFYL
jgi:hypothetical protein